tara:strand:+ start:3035 stop:3313 length:279 start_codon:yes stop_codon:yes gene_type:complete
MSTIENLLTTLKDMQEKQEKQQKLTEEMTTRLTYLITQQAKDSKLIGKALFNLNNQVRRLEKLAGLHEQKEKREVCKECEDNKDFKQFTLKL